MQAITDVRLEQRITKKNSKLVGSISSVTIQHTFMNRISLMLRFQYCSNDIAFLINGHNAASEYRSRGFPTRVIFQS